MHYTCSILHRHLATELDRQKYRGADKFLARPGRKKATATEDFDFYTSSLLSQLEEY
jgi:hypothetical protein